MKAQGNRQADRQAIQGGHNRLVRGGWSPPLEQPPLLDEASTRYPSKKKGKRRPKKEKCRGNPNSHTHEWMKDEEEIPVYRYPRWWESFEKKEQVGTTTQLYRLCAHCGKTQIKRNGSWKSPGYLDNYRYAYKWKGRYRLGW